MPLSPAEPAPAGTARRSRAASKATPTRRCRRATGPDSERRAPERPADQPLEQQHPPTIEQRAQLEGVHEGDEAVDQRVRRDERHEDDERRPRPPQREHAERQRRGATQQEQPPMMAGGGRDVVGSHGRSWGGYREGSYASAAGSSSQGPGGARGLRLAREHRAPPTI